MQIREATEKDRAAVFNLATKLATSYAVSKPEIFVYFAYFAVKNHNPSTQPQFREISELSVVPKKPVSFLRIIDDFRFNPAHRNHVRALL